MLLIYANRSGATTTIEIFTVAIDLIRAIGAVENGIALLTRGDTSAIVTLEFVGQTRRVLVYVIDAVVFVVSVRTVRLPVAPLLDGQTVTAATRLFRRRTLARSRVGVGFFDYDLSRR